MIRSLSRLIGVVEGGFALVAGLIMFLIMAIVAADVAMRYLFNSPFAWSYDLISLYLMTALFYLALSRTFTEGAHISVDIAQYYMSHPVRHLCQVVYALLAAILFATIAWLGLERTLQDYETAAATAGAILWPSWLSDVFVPIGAGLLALRLVVHAAAHGVSLAVGRDLVELPALAGSESSVAKGGFK